MALEAAAGPLTHVALKAETQNPLSLASLKRPYPAVRGFVTRGMSSNGVFWTPPVLDDLERHRDDLCPMMMWLVQPLSLVSSLAEVSRYEGPPLVCVPLRPGRCSVLGTN